MEPVTRDPGGTRLVSSDGDEEIITSATLPDKGFHLKYDLNTTPKEFKLTKSGVSWSDGGSTYNTALSRLAAVQEAFQAVTLPPNPTTLQIDSRLLCYGNSSGGNSIDIDASVPHILINGNPISGSGGTLAQVLTAGNSAGGQDINGVNNINVSTINGMSLNVVGLQWSDFQPISNVSDIFFYNNSGGSTTMNNDNFRVSDSSNNQYNLSTGGLRFYNASLGTESMIFDQMGVYSPVSQLNLNAGGGSYPLAMTYNRLYKNGQPQVRRSYTKYGSFASLPQGAWYDIDSGAPVYTLQLSDYTSSSLTLKVSFTLTVDSYEQSASCYMVYQNQNGSYQGNLYDGSSGPSSGCPQKGSNNVFTNGGTGQNSTFSWTETVSLATDSYGDIMFWPRVGHNGGYWGGSYKAIIIIETFNE